MDEDFDGGEDFEDDGQDFEADTSEPEHQAETSEFEHEPAPAEAPAPEPPRPQQPQQPHDGAAQHQQYQQPQQQAQADPLQQVYQAWEPHVQQWGPGHVAIAQTFAANPAQAVHSMLSFMSKLESDPKGTIAQLSQTYNVQPQDLSPDIMRMVGESQYQVQEAKLQTLLDDFTKDKPHYQELKPQVIQEIVAIRQTSPTLPPDQTLRLAYHNVMERTGYHKILDQRREAERQAEQMRQQKEKAAKARKSTRVNVRSGVTRTALPKTMDDTLGAIAAKHHGR